jgi:hypothetical protein
MLYLEAQMVALAAVWAALLSMDPEIVRSSNNPLVIVGDACWPLHQLWMLVVGIVAVRADSWPSPAKFTLFGPAAGVIVLILASVANVDVIAATAIGAGWAIAGAGVIAVTSKEEPQPRASNAARATALS